MSNSEYRIKVCVRCRPVLPNEAQKGLTNTKVDSS